MLVDKPQLSESLNILPWQKDCQSVCPLPPTFSSAAAQCLSCLHQLPSRSLSFCSCLACSSSLFLVNNFKDFVFASWPHRIYYIVTFYGILTFVVLQMIDVCMLPFSYLKLDLCCNLGSTAGWQVKQHGKKTHSNNSVPSHIPVVTYGLSFISSRHQLDIGVTFDILWSILQ